MELPENAIIPDPIISNEPACENCTHYESEHLEGTNHCTRTIAYLPDPDLEKIAKGSRLNVIHPRIKCDCKHFVRRSESS